jgi:hypothetical protein
MKKVKAEFMTFTFFVFCCDGKAPTNDQIPKQYISTYNRQS